MNSEKQDEDLGVGRILSGLLLWLIALGGLVAGLDDPIYTVAAAIAAGFLFQKG